jgi:phosphotriesterase-related protein
MSRNRTGLSIMVHCPVRKEDSRSIMEIIDQEGCDPSGVVMGHQDASMNGSIDLELEKEIARRGMYVELDLFGREEFRLAEGKMVQMPQDIDRIRSIRHLIDSGFVKQILVSQDICRKYHLKRFGGWGYSHILENIVPIMRMHNFTSDELRILFVENPKRMLTIN